MHVCISPGLGTTNNKNNNFLEHLHPGVESQSRPRQEEQEYIDILTIWHLPNHKHRVFFNLLRYWNRVRKSDLFKIVQLTCGKLWELNPAEFSSLENARTITYWKYVITQARAALWSPLSQENFLTGSVNEQCGGKVEKKMLKQLIIKLLLSTLQHVRRIHLYIKKEYANCKPFLCILTESLWNNPLFNYFLPSTNIQDWDLLIFLAQSLNYQEFFL